MAVGRERSINRRSGRIDSDTESPALGVVEGPAHSHYGVRAWRSIAHCPRRWRRTATGRRRAPERLASIYRDNSGNREQHFAWALAQGGLALAPFQQLWDLTPEQMERLIAAQGCVAHEGYAVGATDLQAWCNAVLALLGEPQHSQGLTQAELQQALPQVSATGLGISLWQLSSSKQLKVTGGRYQLPSHSAQLSDAETKLLALLTKHLDSDQPPSLGDISKLSGTNLDSLKRGAKALAAKGEMVLVGDSRAFLPQRFVALAKLAKELDDFSVKEFRDASGLGRNIVIDVLERLDAKGFTRRDGNSRRVVGDLSLLER